MGNFRLCFVSLNEHNEFAVHFSFEWVRKSINCSHKYFFVCLNFTSTIYLLAIEYHEYSWRKIKRKIEEMKKMTKKNSRCFAAIDFECICVCAIEFQWILHVHIIFQSAMYQE